MAHLLVIGSPSLDTLHFNDETVLSPGGAGMYVAMAARRSGVEVSMFGPYPDPIPEALQPIAERFSSWSGQRVKPEDMPRFEISHRGNKADYIDAFLEAEAAMDPADLPSDLSNYDCIHITALGTADKQEEFFTACEKRGARMISVGTFIENITDQPDITGSLAEKADVFFMNEEEAMQMFGSAEQAQIHPGQVLFITLADKGALVVQGSYQTYVSGVPVQVKDPTGAGESFCGAALANLLQGRHPVMAGRRAAALAAEKVSDIGPSALLCDDQPPVVKLDARVKINKNQVEKIAEVVKNLTEADPFNFVNEHLPPVDHPAALDYFFASTFQQFSFWEDKEGRYHKPLIASINGEMLKGSSYLYAAYMRPLEKDPSFYSPARQANLSRDEMVALFKADDGSDPMPALDLHLEQARQYGQDMLAHDLTPITFMEKVMASPTPLRTFLMMLDHIGGYKEDPLRKKASLLALNLSQRPEKFLRFGEGEAVEPVVDYHCMRSCLRTGLIDVVDTDLKDKIANRELLSEDEERAVRYASYQIQEKVEILSGKPIGAVDWFFFNYTRSHCPEMTEPVCRECALDPVCLHRKGMFQPVIRTVFY